MNKLSVRDNADFSFLILTRALAVFAMVIAVQVLLGWTMNIRMLTSFLPSKVPMNPLTASEFLLAGLCLFLYARPEAGAGPRRAARVLALLVFLIALIRGAGFFGWDIGIDQILFRDRLQVGGTLNRMAPMTTLCFFVLGAAYFLAACCRSLFAAFLALIVNVISVVILAGYVVNVETLYTVSPFIPVALPTALSFFLLSAGFLTWELKVERTIGKMKGVIDWITTYLTGTDSKQPKRRSLWLVIFLLIVLPVGLAEGVSWFYINRELDVLTYSRRQAISDITARTVEERLDHLKGLSTSFASRPRLQELMEQGRWEGAIEIIRDVPRFFPYVDRVLLTDRAGVLKADLPHVPEVIGTDFSFRDWYKGVSRDWKTYVSEVYRRTAPPQRNVVAVASPVRGSDGAVTGIFVMQVRLETILDWVGGIDVGEKGFVYMVDTKGHLVSHPHFSPQDELVDFGSVPNVRKVLQGVRGVEVVFNPVENEEGLAAYTPVPKYGWGVIATQPLDAAFRQKNDTLRVAFVIYVGVFIFAVFLAFLVLKIFEEIIENRRQLAESQKNVLEAVNVKTDFISTVSHELRTPLTAVKESLAIVEEDSGGSLSADQKDFLGTARRNIDRLVRLINQVLDFQKLGAGKMKFLIEENDLNSLVREIGKNLEPMIRQKGLDLLLRIEPDLPGIPFDKDKIAQVLTNLVSNAMKFTDRGRITVRTSTMNGHVRVAVEDEGVGIREEDLPKLFQTFSQISAGSGRKMGGTGLGLAIARQIVEYHHGKIGVESVYGRGSVFYFMLPIQPQGD